MATWNKLTGNAPCENSALSSHLEHADLIFAIKFILKVTIARTGIYAPQRTHCPHENATEQLIFWLIKMKNCPLCRENAIHNSARSALSKWKTLYYLGRTLGIRFRKSDIAGLFMKQAQLQKPDELGIIEIKQTVLLWASMHKKLNDCIFFDKQQQT